MKPIVSHSHEVFGDSYDNFELESGKVLDVNCAIIGINPKLELYAGYDNGINEQELSKAEKMEIAHYMIVLWMKYWDKVSK